MIGYADLDKAKAFQTMKGIAPMDPEAALSPARVGSCAAEIGGGLEYRWAATFAGDDLVAALAELASEQQLLDKYAAVYNGETMNTGEGRKVLHHLCRGRLGGEVLHEGRELGAFYAGETAKIAAFARKVRAGEIRGSTGKAFKVAVQIGIGGSDLGPRALYLALEQQARKRGLLALEAKFVSNVDPDDAAAVIASVDPEETLFILVSKSGTTQETLTNEVFVKDLLAKRGIKGFDVFKHFLAVTSATSPLANNPAYLASFYIDDFIGGRYSSTSAVGGAILSLSLGPETFAELLAGAHEQDLIAKEKDIRRNPALLDALIGVWQRDCLGMASTAILPYSQALSRFPAHLQQLDMESNGKRVNREGRAIAYKTGPAIFGEPGTNGQHSFYQLLHQGTDVIPLQFIGFKRSQAGVDMTFQGSTSQAKLNANLAAQIVAFAKGKADAKANKEFPGGRPSTLILGEELTPAALGALLAFYENKVMFQGLCWNINSFDQEGVQLGKLLTGKVLGGGDIDPALAAYAKLLGAR